MSNPPVLEFRGVTKRFGTLTANDSVSLTLQPGEVLALLGENGAGKTTLMNILFGHYQADEGDILVDGEMLPPGSTQAAISAGIGMVHQHFTLADNLSVLENITLGTESMWSWHHDQASSRQKLAGLIRDYGLVVDPDVLVADLSAPAICSNTDERSIMISGTSMYHLGQRTPTRYKWRRDANINAPAPRVFKPRAYEPG